ncbi:MAG: pyrimidine reductase family protein [Actinomycetales bacterium]|nr:pyrimidine reductase family protein [Actinomycetales bacterium]
MTQLNLLLPDARVVGDLEEGRDATVQALADLYAYPSPVPAQGWVRANVVSSLDGAATGPSGRSASVSNPTDRVVFSVMRGLADVILVGAGTARAERYRSASPKREFAERRAASDQLPAPALAVVTRSGHLPLPSLFAGPAPTCIITSASANVSALRNKFGSERVLVAGDEVVEPGLAVLQLAALGLRRILTEGGPTLLGPTVASGRLDELCLSWSPLMVAGTGPRVAHGLDGQLRLRPGHLLEADGALFGRWLVQRS